MPSPDKSLESLKKADPLVYMKYGPGGMWDIYRENAQRVANGLPEMTDEETAEFQRRKMAQYEIERMNDMAGGQGAKEAQKASRGQYANASRTPAPEDYSGKMSGPMRFDHEVEFPRRPIKFDDAASIAPRGGFVDDMARYASRAGDVLSGIGRVAKRAAGPAAVAGAALEAKAMYDDANSRDWFTRDFGATDPMGLRPSYNYLADLPTYGSAEARRRYNATVSDPRYAEVSPIAYVAQAALGTGDPALTKTFWDAVKDGPIMRGLRGE